MGQRVSKEQKEEMAQLLRRMQLQTQDSEFPVGAFKKFCRIHKNGLEQQDFEDFLLMMNMQHYNSDMVMALFHVLDTNGDGVLDVMEFTRYFILLSRYPLDCKIHMIFDVIDRDSSGTIERQEMLNFYSLLAHSKSYLMDGTVDLPGGSVDTFFNEMDTDRNDVIDRPEFQQHVQRQGPALLQLLDAFIDLDELSAS